MEGQLAIKLNSPSPYTFTAHMCNYYVGYLPVKEAIEHMSTWDTFTNLGSKLDPRALDMVAETSVKLLRKSHHFLQRLPIRNEHGKTRCHLFFIPP